jgi:hypothetical protein
LSELNELRKENDKLKRELDKTSKNQAPIIANLAGLDDNINISGKYWSSGYKRYQECKTSKTWREIFAPVAPYLLRYPNENSVKETLSHAIFSDYETVYIDDQDYQTIKIQLMALKLVTTSYSKAVSGGADFFWSLTQKGQK